MKIGDHVQNVGLRIITIQAVVFVLLTLLGIRLYYLQVVRGEYYSDRAESQRVRLIPIPAPRGAIFDRNGKLLVDSRPIYNVVLSNEPLKTIKVEDRVDDYSHGLSLERQFVVERLLCGIACGSRRVRSDFASLRLCVITVVKDC